MVVCVWLRLHNLDGTKNPKNENFPEIRIRGEINMFLGINGLHDYLVKLLHALGSAIWNEIPFRPRNALWEPPRKLADAILHTILHFWERFWGAPGLHD